MDNEKTKIIFIHGNGGSTVNDNWFPYVKIKLEKLGLNVIAQTFPDNKLAREQYWIPFLKNELKADENTILIGHSSGAVASMRFAEKNKILGSVLVGVSYTDLDNEDEKLSGYFNSPWNWKEIKNNQKWIIQFASSDDPYIPIEEPRLVHKKLNTDYFEYKDQGHFGWNPVKLEFPEIIEEINNKISK